jgi:hypothetical protein
MNSRLLTAHRLVSLCLTSAAAADLPAHRAALGRLAQAKGWPRFEMCHDIEGHQPELRRLQGAVMAGAVQAGFPPLKQARRTLPMCWQHIPHIGHIQDFQWFAPTVASVAFSAPRCPPALLQGRHDTQHPLGARFRCAAVPVSCHGS